MKIKKYKYLEDINEQFSYSERYLKKIVQKAVDKGLVEKRNGVFHITEKGKSDARLRLSYER